MSSKNLKNLSLKQSKKAAATTSSTSITKISSRDGITEYLHGKNGLRILYAHVPGSETLTTTIVYMVGSRHEETGETGLAHMLEHMLFKPTSTKGITWKDLENKGAHLNATTWLDRTLYYFTLPKQYLGDMLQVEADRMRNTLLTNKEFLPERANVQSEYEIQNSTPEEVLTWHIIGSAFENHGYHHDTIGFRNDIDSYTTEKLTAFYNRYYWPHNATLIVAGDVDEKELLTLIDTHFGSIERGTPYVGNARIEAIQEGTRRVSLMRETPLRTIIMAWKAPAFSSNDWLPLYIGLTHLSHGESSPLYKALVEAGFASDAETHLFPTHDPYLAYLTVQTAAKASYTEVEKIIDSIVESLSKKGLTKEGLSLAKETVLTDELASRDGSRAVALSLAEYVASGDWTGYVDTPERIKAITEADVLRALRTYLVKEKCTIGTLNPHA